MGNDSGTKHVKKINKEINEVNDGTASFDEDNDMAIADLVISAGLQDAENKSEDPCCTIVALMQASGAPENKDSKDLPDGDSNSETESETSSGDAVPPEDIGVMNIYEEENAHNNETSNELAGGNRTIGSIDYASQQGELVGGSTISLNIMTLTGQTTKHHVVSNNGYDMAIVGDTGNLEVVVCNENINIPALQNVNPPLLEQHQYPLLPPEQAEGISMFNPPFSMNLDTPHTMEGSPILLFAELPEDTQQGISHIEETLAEDDEENVSSSDMIENVDDADERFEMT